MRTTHKLTTHQMTNRHRLESEPRSVIGSKIKKHLLARPQKIMIYSLYRLTSQEQNYEYVYYMVEGKHTMK